MSNTNENIQKVLFWQAPNDALFTDTEISNIFDVSKSWLQKKRITGGGIPFIRLSERKVRYMKSDIVDFFNNKKKRYNTTESD